MFSYSVGTVNMSAWLWQKNRHIDEWNITESPGINLYFYSQLIFNRGSKHKQWAKDSLFNKWYWKIEQKHAEK